MSDLKEAMAPQELKRKPIVRSLTPNRPLSPQEQRMDDMGNKMQSDLEKAFEGTDTEVRRDGSRIILDKKRAK